MLWRWMKEKPGDAAICILLMGSVMVFILGMHWGLVLFIFVVITLVAWLIDGWKNIKAEAIKDLSSSEEIGSSNFEKIDPENISVGFNDIAGYESAKKELQETIDFLKNPEKFKKLGAEVPKGVLYSGPPGTGKTLFAKATAKESGVPFFSVSGSDFVEIYVGVGAKRVRELFKEARKCAPSIIFIDEIDSVGGKRGSGNSGGSDEREQTLNQILAEMDGFNGENVDVIVIGATNRLDKMDSALTRPGRFDRQVIIGLPTVEEREAILKIHGKNKPLAQDVDMKQLAKRTSQMSGADLKNILNEAAILAGRRGKSKIDNEDVKGAIDRVIAGSETAVKPSEKEKKVIAYHESGHYLVAELLMDADPPEKITIIPRGRSLGHVQIVPEEERHIHTMRHIKARIAVSLGGRVAEQIKFGKNFKTSGAQDDIKKLPD